MYVTLRGQNRTFRAVIDTGASRSFIKVGLVDWRTIEEASLPSFGFENIIGQAFIEVAYPGGKIEILLFVVTELPEDIVMGRDFLQIAGLM